MFRSFALSTKKGKEAWIHPAVDRQSKTVQFVVRRDRPPDTASPKIGRGGSFRCLVCDQVAPEDYVKSEGVAARMGARLLAVVAEGRRGRVYVSPDAEQEQAAMAADPTWGPDEELSTHPQYMGPPRYGLTRFRELFSPRQLLALTTFVELIGEVRRRVLRDAIDAGWRDDDVALESGGSGARAYAEAVATYLAFAISKGANYWSTACSWHQSAEKMVSTFGLPVMPMVWDYAEANPFSSSTGNWDLGVAQAAESLEAAPAAGSAAVRANDALTAINDASGAASVLVSTDPPYYDNVPYADLSDFFYVWLRHSVGDIYPELFRTLLTPKAEELVSDQNRFGGKKGAKEHFERGLAASFQAMRRVSDSRYPVSVYYAFRQAESRSTDGSGPQIVSTGWETMLTALIGAGFVVDGTWPIRTEQEGGLREAGRNALASSILLVCRPRGATSEMTDRRGFMNAVRAELPEAVRVLQHGNVAPVDLAQAAIGPGIAVFSRFSKVMEPDGTPMPVRAALAIINQVLSEVLAEQEDEFDPDTRWAIAWYEQHGTGEGRFGEAELLTKAKNTALNGLRQAGIIFDGAGRVRLKRRDELSADWDPAADQRLTIWEVTQHFIRLLDAGGEPAAADLARRVGGVAETARDLAYRLYAICERKKWAEEAVGYNALVTAWPEITRLAASSSSTDPEQTRLFS